MSRSLFTHLVAFAISLAASQSLAQAPAEIRGFVFDAVSNEPLPDANIVAVGASLGAAADTRGFFRIKDVPPGEYTIRVSRIGYESKSAPANVAAGERFVLSFALKARTVKFEEVIVTAQRESRLRSEVSVASQILSRAYIERSAVESVGEAVEGATGLFVKNYGSLSSLKTASIRGSSENQVLVLLDGHRLNLAQGTAPDLGDIPLQAVERIEIVRGGHSALYGSDAVGGVINLITRSGSSTGRPSGEVSSTFGSYGTRIVTASLGQKPGRFSYFLTHKITDSDGDFKFEEADSGSVKRSNNRLDYNDTFVKVGYQFSAASSLNAFVQRHDAERGVPGPLSFLSDSTRQRDRSWKYNLSYQNDFSSALHFEGQAFLYKFKQNFDDRSVLFPISSEHRNDIYGFDAQSNWRAFSGHTLSAGVEFRREKINSTNVGKRARSTTGVFLQDQIDLPLGDAETRLTFIPALRLDDYSDLNAEVSPKLGVVFKSVRKVGVTARGNIGRSYRVPSFNDLYWPAGPFARGNANLVPEKGFGYDFGLALDLRSHGYWSVEANYFDTNLDDLIIWGPDAAGVFSPRNVQKASLSGLEARTSFHGLNDLLDIAFDYTYLRPRDETTSGGKDLIYRPRQQLNLTLALDLRVFRLGAVWHHVGKRYTSVDNLAQLSASNVAHVSVSRRQDFGDVGLRIVAEARNLFDDQTEIIQGYPVPGREYRTAVSFEF